MKGVEREVETRRRLEPGSEWATWSRFEVVGNNASGEGVCRGV